MCETCGIDTANPFAKPDATCDDFWDRVDDARDQAKAER